MGDKDNAVSFIAQNAKNLKELLRLLRRQYRSWLIQDQQLRFPEQGLQYLYPLLLTHRKLIDPLLQIYVKSVFFTQSGNQLPLSLPADKGIPFCAQP